MIRSSWIILGGLNYGTIKKRERERESWQGRKPQRIVQTPELVRTRYPPRSEEEIAVYRQGMALFSHYLPWRFTASFQKPCRKLGFPLALIVCSFGYTDEKSFLNKLKLCSCSLSKKQIKNSQYTKVPNKYIPCLLVSYVIIYGHSTWVLCCWDCQLFYNVPFPLS